MKQCVISISNTQDEIQFACTHMFKCHVPFLQTGKIF